MFFADECATHALQLAPSVTRPEVWQQADHAHERRSRIVERAMPVPCRRSEVYVIETRRS